MPSLTHLEWQRCKQTKKAYLFVSTVCVHSSWMRNCGHLSLPRSQVAPPYLPGRWHTLQTTPCLFHSLHCTALQNELFPPGQSPHCGKKGQKNSAGAVGVKRSVKDSVYLQKNIFLHTKSMQLSVTMQRCRKFVNHSKSNLYNHS